MRSLQYEIGDLPSLLERSVDRDLVTGCMVWVGGHDSHGYGVWYPSRKLLHESMAHRAAWALRHGPIPDGSLVLHSCDNPPCVNVDHLRLGSHAENMADRQDRQRQARGRRIWTTKLTPEDVRHIRRLLAEGFTPSELGRQYNVSGNCIRKIVIGKNWRWVA